MILIIVKKKETVGTFALVKIIDVIKTNYGRKKRQTVGLLSFI